jgi:hypothetical protein
VTGSHCLPQIARIPLPSNSGSRAHRQNLAFECHLGVRTTDCGVQGKNALQKPIGAGGTMLKLTWPLFLVLAILALRGSRWAYAGFVLLSLTSFAARVHFQLEPRACELQFDAGLALFSLTNYWHMVLFGFFYILSYPQFRERGSAAVAWSVGATLVMGALVEMAQGVSGSGHCRARDLIPDLAGALIGAGLVLLWSKGREVWQRQ